MANKFYAVRKGLVPGVYDNWAECQANVNGYPGAEYKSFKTREEAEAFVAGKVPIVQEKPKEISGVLKPKELGFAYAFVDGSFNSDTGDYGYGGFLHHDGKNYPLKGLGSDAEMATMRNVAGEICGAMAAVRKAEELGIKELTLFYDYQGIECWVTGAWKTKKTYTFEYAHFMRSNERAVKIKFEHVKGHTGIYGNELADVMAKDAVGIKLTKNQRAMVDMMDLEAKALLESKGTC